jgi:hypothetical protein
MFQTNKGDIEFVAREINLTFMSWNVLGNYNLFATNYI